jgi:hypothetical protein
MVMGNPLQGVQIAGAPGGMRGTNQPLVLVFERDESLAGSLLGQLRGQGYEARSARTPVEVFDVIARYPVGLVLVNLGQAATSRREFWVALDAQRRGRGVQVITYRVVVPGVEPDIPDGSGRGALADVEVRGAQNFSTLVDAVRQRLPLPTRQSPDSAFLLGSLPASRGPMSGQPAPGAPPGLSGTPGISGMPSLPGLPGTPPNGPSPDPGAQQAHIAGVLNLTAGSQPGQMPEFAPLSPMPGAPGMNPGNGSWSPSLPTGQALPGAANQGPPQWLTGRVEPPGTPVEMGAPVRPAAPVRPEMAGNGDLSRAGGMPIPPAAPSGGVSTSRPAGAAGMDNFTRGATLNASMPMGDLNALSDAINALAAAGAPGYQNAAAAANAMNAASAAGGEGSRWGRDQSRPSQGAGAMAAWDMTGAYASGAPAGMNGERQPPDGMRQMNNGGQPAPRGQPETMVMNQQAFASGRPPQEMSRPQETRSYPLSPGRNGYEPTRVERPGNTHNRVDGPTQADARPPSGSVTPPAGGQSPIYQNQMLSPVVAPGRVERSLGNVLVEGQLVSQQRLEVALGIQRLLRGVDLDYRLGELLLLFKFLTPDQLLAALLVSRGMVTPAQVASMGRIKQELHAIGMEYDLENLLILFRLLSSEQLREIRSELS